MIHEDNEHSQSKSINSVKINNHEILGLQINLKTGCEHYNSPLDIVAIKFKCCEEYYSCYLCHLAMAKHSVQRWKPDDLNKHAILCGHCGFELTIYQYLFGDNKCLKCGSLFNTKCKLHWDLYFEESCFESEK